MASPLMAPTSPSGHSKVEAGAARAAVRIAVRFVPWKSRPCWVGGWPAASSVCAPRPTRRRPVEAHVVRDPARPEELAQALVLACRTARTGREWHIAHEARSGGAMGSGEVVGPREEAAAAGWEAETRGLRRNRRTHRELRSRRAAQAHEGRGAREGCPRVTARERFREANHEASVDQCEKVT